MWSVLLKFLPSIFGFLKPLFAPMLAWFKGRSDAKRNAALKAERKDNAIIDKGKRAGRDAADSGKLSDGYFRD